MSPVKIAALSGTSGFAAGVGMSWLTLLRRLRRDGCPDPEAHLLSAGDRDQLADEFAQHMTAVKRQVTDFADALANGDPVLRERQRRFEVGGRP